MDTAREKLIILVRARDRKAAEIERLKTEVDRIDADIDALVAPAQSSLPLAPAPEPRGLAAVILRVLENSTRALGSKELAKKAGATNMKSFRTTIYRLKKDKKIKTAHRGLYKINHETRGGSAALTQ